MKRIFIFILFMYFLCVNVLAHGDLHQRVLRITKEININPDNALLYFKRGKLYYYHNEYKKSLKDFRVTQKLGFRSTEQQYFLSKVFFKLKRINKSKKLVDKILEQQPYNVNALKLLGDIYFKVKRFEKSALSYEKVIIYSKAPLPENYLNASNAWFNLRTNNGTDRAQSILIEGIEELGNIIVLYNRIVDNFLILGDYSSAITYQKKLLNISHRKEKYYLKLASIFILQKKYPEANRALNNAKLNYHKLPRRIKATKFMKELYSELKLKEEILKTKTYTDYETKLP